MEYRDFINTNMNDVITALNGSITPAPVNSELYRDFLNRKADDVITALNGSITPAPAGDELYRDFIERKFDDVIAGIGGYVPPVTFPTVSGSVCNFNSQYAGLPLKAHTIALTATQSGSGTPSPVNIRNINGYSAIGISQTDGNFTTYSDLTIPTTNANAIDIATIPVVVGKTYTIYCEQDTSLTSSTRNTLYLSTSDGTFIENNTANYHNDAGCHILTYTCATAGNMTVRYWGHTPSTTLIISNIIISDSVFNNSIIQIGSTVYGGEYDARTGVLTVTHGFYTVTGSESWSAWGRAYYTYSLPRVAPNVTNVINCIASKLEGVKVGDLYDNTVSSGCGVRGSALYISSSDYANRADLVGMQVCYKFNAPITIQLPPCPIDTLEGVNNIWADTGDTTLQYIKIGGNT